MKKIIVVSLIVLASTAWAKDKVFVQGNISFPIGIGLTAGWNINDRWSVGVSTFVASSMPDPIYYDVMVSGWWFPWKKRFYVSTGLGYVKIEDCIQGTDDWEIERAMVLIPGFGWNFDPGKKGGFYLGPQVQFVVPLGPTEEYKTIQISLNLGWSFL